MSVEGIGGLKWSVFPVEVYDKPTVYTVMQGVTVVCTVADLKLARLICGAPQLWAAANAALLAGNSEHLPGDVDPAAQALHALGEQVARCVGKGAWKDVAQ